MDIGRIDRARTLKVAKTAVLLALLLSVAPPHSSDRIVTASPDGRVMMFRTASDLDAYYGGIGYTLEAVSSGAVKVPRLYLARMPGDWDGDTSIQMKKSVFYRTMLPLVLRVNEAVRAERERLLDLRRGLAAGGSLSPHDAAWLARQARTYEALPKDTATVKAVGVLSSDKRRALFDRLRLRMDGVPPSLALGQAAVESAYATSRFASEGNALFGQWREGGGMTPVDQRAAKSDFGVAAFATPLDSVRAYVNNLNSHPAYAAFRGRRAEMRRAGGRLEGERLALTLGNYAETGAEYIATLRDIIRRDRLDRLDGAGLDGGGLARPVPVAQGG